MSKLKVFGATIEGQYYAVFAASSKKKAAEAFGMSAYEMQRSINVTGNAGDIARAMSKPGQLFVRVLDGRPHKWHKTMKAVRDEKYAAALSRGDYER